VGRSDDSQTHRQEGDMTDGMADTENELGVGGCAGAQ